jgi:putative serine esterase DUF676
LLRGTDSLDWYILNSISFKSHFSLCAASEVSTPSSSVGQFPSANHGDVMSVSVASSRSSLHVPGADEGFGLPPRGAGTVYPEWTSADPRSSSAQSLAPSFKDDGVPETRRTLLAIYIHGFMGNDSSFRSFPAHVHSYLKNALEETHVIHSKIYPRYKTYRAIEVARDNLSKWLEPHESETTDVILLGHSMGGLLAAEVVLIVPPPSQHSCM